ncbi:MAG: hypothetical protein AAF799_27285 [Myxococcota bacterium]
MKMLELNPRSLLCGMLLAAAACSPPHVHQQVQGPEVTMTAADSIAEFDVTVCMDIPRRVDSISSTTIFVNADVEVTGGERGGLLRGLLEGGDEERFEDQLDLDAPQQIDEWGEDGDDLAFDLRLDDDWGGSGRSCAEPQRMRFEYFGEEPAAEVRLTWTVDFYADYFSRGLRAANFSDDAVTIEIEAVQ